MSDAALGGAEAGLVSCHACELLSRPARAGHPGHCLRCGAALEWRRPATQIRRGTKASTASMVSTTPAMKKPAPGTGSTDMRGWSWMRATVNVSTKTSSIDHLPMIPTRRYSRARSRLLVTDPRCTVIRRYASAISLPSGIMTLAISTITASGHEPDV